MSEIEPSLQLLYRLMLDGGSILSCNRYGEIYVADVEPNPEFNTAEVITKYGSDHGPFLIVLRREGECSRLLRKLL